MSTRYDSADGTQAWTVEPTYSGQYAVTHYAAETAAGNAAGNLERVGEALYATYEQAARAAQAQAA